MINTSTQLGVYIKHTRTRMGVTQEKLAMVAGTGLRFIIDLEKGKPTCEIGKVLMVLTSLGIKIDLTPPMTDVTEPMSSAQQRGNR